MILNAAKTGIKAIGLRLFKLGCGYMFVCSYCIRNDQAKYLLEN